MWRRACPALAALAVLLGIAGCGIPTASAQAPQSAGKSPSAIARMVCTPKAAREIAQVVGAKAAVTAPTWADSLYACAYRYSKGTMVLSVKELSSWTQTFAYFDQLARTLHRTAPIGEFGQGAFSVRNGSVVVRKDWKVLLVDTSGLRGNIGSPPNPPSQVAINVAGVILGCWTGD
ncbi:MAG TPA: hypothetical protein VII22_14460 [Streptosporangiaceae bacterium]